MADLTPDDLRRAMARPGFRWMPGMRITHYVTGAAGTVLEGSHDYAIWHGEGATSDGGGWHEAFPPHPDLLPDYTDPATAGCLLDLLGDAVRNVQRDPTGTRWAIVYNTPEGPRRTEWNDHLGTAAVRVALARGEWPGGAR